MERAFFLTLGWLAVGLGFIGIVLPGLPTTPFLLVAAFAFGKGSPRLRLWLVEHPRLGPPIIDWEERGAISRRAKAMAVGAMTLVFFLSWAFGVPAAVLAIQALAMGGVAIFIVTRPD